MKMIPKNTSESYNGWSNYDTWCFKLWLDNDKKSQEIVLNEVKKAHKKYLKVSTSIFAIQKFLEVNALMNVPKLENGFYSDVLNASIRSINYYQIADAYYWDYLENFNLDKKTA